MPYGLEQRSLVENGLAMANASVQADGASSLYRAWRKLSPDKRLAAVERKLNAVNLSDGYPLAL